MATSKEAGMKDVTYELTMELAERITKFYRSFDSSPRRDEYKAAFQLAIGRAITDQLIIATRREMEGPQDIARLASTVDPLYLKGLWQRIRYTLEGRENRQVRELFEAEIAEMEKRNAE